jgi:hypothetical protein
MVLIWGVHPPASQQVRRRDVERIVCGAAALCLFFSAPLYAQNSAIEELKIKIFDARTLQQTFAKGLKFCNELNGTNFYFAVRDRVFSLEEFHRSLSSLVRQQAFNPEKKRPWSEQDASDRWVQVQQEAAKDKANCQLAASLPDLEKQLNELQKTAAPAEQKN